MGKRTAGWWISNERKAQGALSFALTEGEVNEGCFATWGRVEKATIAALYRSGLLQKKADGWYVLTPWGETVTRAFRASAKAQRLAEVSP